jgi:Glycosyltransferase family 87
VRSGRPLLFGVAAFQVVFGLVVGALIAPHTWLVDASRDLQAAVDLGAGRFGTDHGYLYSSLAALLTVPATWIAAPVAGGIWLAVRFAALAFGVARATRGMLIVDRVLILVAATMFVPTLQDLMLGNVTILLAVAVGVVAWSPDRARTGIPLGIVLATVPKPALIPILVWMLVFRRRALAGSIATAGILTLIGLVTLGLDAYLAWADVLRAPDYLSSGQAGNLALGGLLPPLVAIPLSVLAIAAGLLALQRGETQGFVAAIAVGLLVAPYTIAYGAVLLLLVVRPLSVVVPLAALAAAAIVAPVLVIVFMPLLAGGVLAVAAGIEPVRWKGIS